MDYSILIVLCVLVGAILGVIGVKYAQRKGIFTSEDLLKVAKAFDLSIDLIKELKLNKEPEILKIADIINDALEMGIAISKTTKKENIEEFVSIKVKETCAKLDVVITPDREQLIGELINIGLNNSFIK